jgi:hypothetical protein
LAKLFATMFFSLALVSAGCGSDSGTAGDGSAPADGGLAVDTPASTGDAPAADIVTAVDGGAADTAAASNDGAPATDTGVISADAGNVDVNLMSGFVRGTIAGEVLDYGALVGSTVGSPPGYVQIGGHKALNGNDYWALNVPNVAGTYMCNDGMHPFLGVSFVRSEGGPIGNMYSSGDKGSCTVTLTQAVDKVGDVAKGTFTAKLISLYDKTKMVEVTEGAFEAARYQ